MKPERDPAVIAKADQQFAGLQDTIGRLIQAWHVVKPVYESEKLSHLDQVSAFAGLMTQMEFDVSGLLVVIALCTEKMAGYPW